MKSNTSVAIRTFLLRYGGAVLFTSLALLVRWALNPWLGDYVPFATLYGAVAAAVWFGGVRSAVVATLLGYVVANRIVLGASGGVFSQQPREYIALVLYLFSCAVIVVLGEGMRIARRRAEASREQAIHKQRQLESEVVQRRQAEERVHSLVNTVIDGIINRNELDSTPSRAVESSTRPAGRARYGNGDWLEGSRAPGKLDVRPPGKSLAAAALNRDDAQALELF